jgi:hypothetical protein
MLSFISENLATIIVGAVVFAIFAGVVIKLVRERKLKKTSCGCGCSGCPSAKDCH